MPDPITPRERLLAVAEALTRTEAALESMAAAAKSAGRGLPHDHPVVEDLGEIHRRLLAARAKLEMALRRCP